MICLQCSYLAEAFKLRLAAYVRARADPFFRVSTELAASRLVDVERARNDLEDHRLASHFASPILVHS